MPSGRGVAVFRCADGWAALDARCPHAGGPLADGIVADGCVTCPLHDWRFDLASGERRAPDGGGTRVRKVRDVVPAGAAGSIGAPSARRGRWQAPCAVRTTCPYCGVGCGVIAERRAAAADHGARAIRCTRSTSAASAARASALAETIARRTPLGACCRRAGGGLGCRARPSSADGFARIIREHGPDAIAFYISGQLLTEDYYVVNKLAKGFLRHQQRRLQLAAVHGVQRSPATSARSAATPSPAATTTSSRRTSWSSSARTRPGAIRSCASACWRRRRPTRPAASSSIDPRRTATGEGADLHLPVRSGSDCRAVQRIAGRSDADDNAVDRAFVAHYTNGVRGRAGARCRD